MISIEQTVMHKNFIVQKQFHRQVRELTTFLITALKINPYDRNLVSACGEGTEHDNCEAVYHWLKQEACCVSCIKAIDMYEIQRRFVRFLLENTSQTEYYE
ncbi:hypothetical protein [Rheinheimera salexigens]|uniref:Uncharacterized protein n=1 Tax=Rheinheimera salexigens TaxID=1628148 RepID=A0A1E7Q7B8_9GAMM|nr:hypothetical protein [Rheinheimera salexigens]OEY70094.1 hypothetical protein BI198_11340 [Rheinheimera salexigens]